MSAPATPTEGTRTSENANERFERLAEQFYRETGLMAPGKDMPAAMGGSEPSYYERFAKWREWLTYARATTPAPLAADADAGGETTPNFDAPYQAHAEACLICDHGLATALCPEGARLHNEATRAWVEDGHARRKRSCSAATPSAPSPATTGEGLDEDLSETQCSLAVMRLATTMDDEDPTAAMADVDQRFARFRAVVASLLARVAQAEQDAERYCGATATAFGSTVRCGKSPHKRHVLHFDADHMISFPDAARATPTTETDR